MKIAICLSGYMRAYKDLYENFYKNLYLPCSKVATVDIFISTWDTLNSKYTFSHKQNDAPLEYEELDKNDIIARFNPKSINFHNFDSLKDSFNIHNYDKSIDLATLYPTIHENGILFCLSMFYKRLDCNELKKEHERKMGEKYDIVIQMRPDIFFLRPLQIDKIDPNKLSSRTFYNDHMHISSSENIDKISDVYLQVGRIMNQYKTQRPLWFEPYCPEYFLEHLYREIGFDEKNRVELGDDLITAYPRKNFIATIIFILDKHKRMSEINDVLNYPLNRVY